MGGAIQLLGGAKTMLQKIALLQILYSLFLLSGTVQTSQSLSVPVFSAQPTDTIVALRSQAELNCRATGDPTPTYSYTHNNSVVANDNTGRVTISDGTLIIRNYAVSDAGQYVCTASNSEGSSNSRTATLRTAYIADSFTTYPTSQTLLSHTSFSISCAIDSLPEADIMFFQDDVLLDVSSDNHLTTTKISIGSRLNINDVHLSDAGDYYCGAMNSVNSGYVTGATVTITVQGPPEFVQTPQSLSIREGSDARLDCVVTGVPKPVLTWQTPGGGSLPSTSSSRFSVSSNNSLVISKVQKSDAGLYTCSASNKFGSPSASSRLTVLDPLSKPSFTTVPTNLTTVVNSSITINCVASGNPSPTVTWEKNEESLTYNSRVTFLSSQGVLRITSVREEDSGRYKCIAVNSQGSVTAQAVVTVQVPPVINSTLSDLVLEEGAPLVVYCTATGKPPPSITFSYPSTANVVTKVTGRLRVASLGRSDAGDYSCTAKNTVGQAKRQFNLRVQGKPYFVRTPNNVAVTTGATVTFYCDVAGDPLPTKNWTKSNRIPLPKDPRYRTPSTGELQIKNVVNTDAGVYECRGSNRYGEVVASGILSVNVFPSFTQRPADVEVVQGNTATFECIATGTPSPTYKWTFPNGTVVRSDPLSRFLSDGGMFTIRGLTAADQGRYTCIATNAAGSIASAATVTMLIFPTFTVTPSDTIFVAGQTAKFPCAATGVNQPTISWNLIPAQGEKRPLTSARYSVASTGTLSISTIQKTDEGTYECQATNRAGANTARARLKVHIQPVAFLTQSTLTVTLGLDTTWRCNISEGDPAPTFKWTLATGNPLPNTGRFVDSGDGLLTVKSVKLEDAGQYSCQATNYVGSSTATGTLNVQVIPTISFIDAKPALLGGTAILDCNATGLPNPTIVWKTNNLRIPISGAYSQATNGSLIISRVERRDQRTYQCEAVNAAGTTSRKVALTLILPPSPPTSPVASDIEVHAVTLTWTVSDGGSPLTGHNIDYFVGNHWSAEPIRVDGNTTQRVTGLTGYTEYFFRVQAINIVGPSAIGATSEKVMTSIGGPSAPRSFTATVTGSGSVELTWSSSEFPNGPLQYYEIEYESQDGIEEIAKETHRYKNISNMHYNVTGLYPYISYIFRIRGNNGGDELWGDYAETTTITQEAVPTAAPQDVQLEAAGRPEIVVSWQPPPPIGRNGPVVGYFLYYRLITEESETTEYQRLFLEGQPKSYVINAEGNSNYGVIMSMSNNVGVGPNSTEVTLSTPPVAFAEKQSGDSLGTGAQAAIAVGVVCFTLLCLVIVMSFYYRYKMRTAVITMNARDEELGNDDAVGGGRETGGNGYLPESPEVRAKNVRGKYRKRKSEKSMTIPVSKPRTDTTGSAEITRETEPESPRYAEPNVAFIPSAESVDSQAVTAGESSAVYAKVDIGSKRNRNERKDELEEQRRQEEAQERQKAEIERKKQEEARRKEVETRKKREEKKRRDDETKRVKEMMKRDKKNRQDRGKAAKKRASTGRGYDLSYESDFGRAKLF